MNKIVILMMILSSSVFEVLGQMSDEILDQNDPQCPCYKIQKQAELEYKDLLRKHSKFNVDNNGGNEPVLTKNKWRREDRGRKRKKYTGKAVCPNL